MFHKPLTSALLFSCLLSPGTLGARPQSPAPAGAGMDARVTQLYAEAKAAEGRGDVAGAIARYESSILRAAPGLVAAYNNLGALLVRSREFRKAADVLAKGLAIDPAMSSASALLGVARYELADYAAARRPLELALQANPKDDTARLMLANTLVKLSLFEPAARHLEELARHDPKNQETWYLLGTVYMRLSEQALARLREIDPDSALMHEISGDVMAGMKNYDGAVVEYQKALAKDAGRSAGHYKLGDLYWTTAQWDLATHEFEAALENDPNNCEARWKLGNILLEQSAKIDDALADVDAALALCPNLTQARSDRGRALLKLARYEDAVRELQVAEKASPEEPSIHFFLAQALRASGRAEDAQAEMQLFARLQESERAATARQAQDVAKSKQQNP